MAKTNLELAIDALTIMHNVNDGYDLFEFTDESYQVQLMQEAPEKLYGIFSILKDAYAPKVELKSIVEISESLEMMTSKQFDNTRFSKEDCIEYQGKKYPITGIDFDVYQFEIWYNDNESNLWLDCTECIYLPKK